MIAIIKICVSTKIYGSLICEIVYTIEGRGLMLVWWYDSTHWQSINAHIFDVFVKPKNKHGKKIREPFFFAKTHVCAIVICTQEGKKWIWEFKASRKISYQIIVNWAHQHDAMHRLLTPPTRHVCRNFEHMFLRVKLELTSWLCGMRRENRCRW